MYVGASQVALVGKNQAYLIDSSVGKESTCNAGDPGSIPRLGSSPGEGIVYQLQYSWTSLVVQTVKNPPAMWENWGRCPRERNGYPLQYSYLANSMDRGAWRAI